MSFCTKHSLFLFNINLNIVFCCLYTQSASVSYKCLEVFDAIHVFLKYATSFLIVAIICTFGMYILSCTENSTSNNMRFFLI